MMHEIQIQTFGQSAMVNGHHYTAQWANGELLFWARDGVRFSKCYALPPELKNPFACSKKSKRQP